jgi:hypothetical protein
MRKNKSGREEEGEERERKWRRKLDNTPPLLLFSLSGNDIERVWQ